MPKGWISTADAATLIKITTGRVRQLAATGLLKGERTGRDWIISEADAKRYARERPNRGPKPKKGVKP